MYKWPILLNEITRLQIELTSYCNANCPSCERYDYYYDNSNPYGRKLNNNHISISDFEKWINHDFKNLKKIHFCGNIDEPTLNPDLLKICDYINSRYPYVEIWIATNGGTKNKKFWQKLANFNTVVVFGIDGLSDTNHIYRKNVSWLKLEQNYKSYIKHGGKAIWQFIVFEHNKHQLLSAKKMSEDNNFFAFNEKYSERENHEVIEIKKHNLEKQNLKCKATHLNSELEKSFFIDVNGTVWPCCWMATAHYTKKFYDFFGSDMNHVFENNLKFNTLDEIIEGDIFSKLWTNLQNLEICNIKCKKNEIDEDNYKIN